MKIVILPGVGFHDSESAAPLMDNIRYHIKDADVEYYDWQHTGLSAVRVPFYEDVLHSGIREFTQEVIMDFEYVINHAYTMVIPRADLYIGHSAGSIIAITRDSPCIIFGSPAAILEHVEDGDGSYVLQNRIQNSDKTLNILNKNDPIGLPLMISGVENFYYCADWINPFGAHTDYWSSKTVGNKIVSTIKEWFYDR
jgi:hypothetical protein